MTEMIAVYPGKRMYLASPDSRILFTAGLEACVGVGGIAMNGKALIHVRQTDNVDAFLDWFEEKISPQEGRICIAGGMRGKAEDFVAYIRKRLSNYSTTTEAVLTEYMIDLLVRDSQFEVSKNRILRTPSGLTTIPASVHYL